MLCPITGGFPQKEGLAKLENMIKSFGTIIGLLLPEFCTQIAFNEVRGQVAAIDLGDDCYSKIQVSIFSKYF